MKSKLFIIITFLTLLTTGVALLAYTGPGDRSQVNGNAIERLVCASTQYTGGPLIWRYRNWDNAIAAEGSAMALSWQASYPNVDDPSTPGCNSGRDGVYVWQSISSTLTYSPATFSLALNCSAGLNGWCRNGKLDFSAIEPIPGKQITTIESSGQGNLCAINAASGSCSWSPPDGIGATNIWANSSFGDSSLLQGASWKMDRTPPLLSISVPVADGSNGWFKTAPTLSLAASDALSGLGSAVFSGGGSTQRVSTDGVNTISATATDNAGNTATQTTVVKVDQSAPAITFAPTSAAGPSGWRSNGTITLRAIDPVSGFASASYRVDGGAATSMASSTVLTLPDGKHSIVVSANDQAGNAGTDSLTNFWVDSTPPILFIGLTGMASSGWYTTNVTASITAVDSLSGVASTFYKLDGGPWQPGMSVLVQTEGAHTVDFQVTDQAGNQSISTKSFQIDKTVPSAAFVPSGLHGNNGWFRSMVSLALNPTDAGSGIASNDYSLNSGAWQAWIGDLRFVDGVNYIQALVSDRAGNQVALGLYVRVDSQAPVLDPSMEGTSGQDSWYVSDVLSTVTALDENSGLALLEYSLDYGDWLPGSSVLTTTDGDHSITYRATDLAGNQSNVTRDFSLDKTAPALSLSIPYAPDGQNGWYVTQPTISLTASDATSGLASSAFDNGGSSFITADGTQNVSATAKDIAGNSATVSQTFKVDTTPPTLTPSITATGANGWYNAAVNISINTMDGISGVGSTEYRLDGGNWNSGSGLSVSTEGNHLVEMRVTDNAGNVTTASRSFKVDITKPVSAFINPPEGTQIKAAGTVSFSGSSSDALSGLAATEISLDNGATWLPLPSTSGAWSYSWDTLRIPDGIYTILVHADDRAGNRENTARVQVVVGNKPPKVEISPSWWLWEAGSIKVVPGQIPLRDVSVRIACDPNHPDVLLNFTGENFPSDLKWDRLCGNGAYAAESGDYAVTLTACDTFGHCAEDAGVIKVPFIAPRFAWQIVPTWTPTVEPSPTPMATTTAHPTMQPTAQVLVTAAPSPIPTPAIPAPEPAWLAWSFGTLLAGLLALALSAVLDPRPRALRRLGKTLARLASDDQG